MNTNIISFKDKFEVGQVWEYNTRKGEENSTITIVNIEENNESDIIINIYVSDLLLKNPISEDGFSDTIQHLPFSKEAIEKSVTRLICKTNTLPDYKDCYDEWKTAFNMREASIFGNTIKETIDVIEITLNQ
jgi:hypothetical protein